MAFCMIIFPFQEMFLKFLTLDTYKWKVKGLIFGSIVYAAESQLVFEIFHYNVAFT